MNIWGNSAWAFDAFNYLTPYKDMLDKVTVQIQHTNGTDVLDLGCGTGNLELGLCRSNLKIFAIDSSPAMIDRAKQKCPNQTFQVADLNSRLAFEQGSFDLVISIHSLYLLDNMSHALFEMKRVLKEGGTLVLVHPQPKGFGSFVKAHFTSGKYLTILKSLTQLPRLLNILSSGMEVERSKQGNFLEPSQLSSLVESIGFEIVNIEDTYGDISTLLVARR